MRLIADRDDTNPLAGFLEYLCDLPGCFSSPVPLGNGTEPTVRLA